MNALRVELHCQDKPQATEFPCSLQRSEGCLLVLIGKDTPLFRAKLIEFVLSNPKTVVVASACFVGTVQEFANPHKLIHQTFAETAPTPLSFNVKDASKRLGISYSHIRELIHLGQIKKLRGRISSAELNRYLNERNRR